MPTEGITMDEWQAEMERVLELEAAAHKPRVPWTPQEDEILTKFYGRVHTAKLAAILERTTAATFTRAQRLGLTVPGHERS